MGDRDHHRIVRQMGLTSKEFLRSLPAAVAGRDVRIEGPRILIEDAARRIEIRLGPEREHRLGSLLLPRIDVDLLFEGFSADERDRFLKRFDLAFQRGGG